jgi:hypothetical protein
MGKPLHKAAIVMWVLAAAIFAIWAFTVIRFLLSYPIQMLNVGTTVYGAFEGAVLVALGTLIEIADHVRWNTLPPEARKRRTPVWSYVRSWPHSMQD